MWNDLMTELESALEQFVSQKDNQNKRQSAWVKHKVKKQLRKHKQQRGWSKFNRVSQHYKACKWFVQRQTWQAYWSHINNKISPNEDETIQWRNKRFCWFIKHKKQDTQGVAPLKSNRKLENNSNKKATILNNQFKSVISDLFPLSLEQLSKQTMNDSSPKVLQMDPFVIMEEGIRKLLSGLNPITKLLALTNYSHSFLKRACICPGPNGDPHLQCLQKTKKVTRDGKTANVAPIFKKGEKYKASNCCPISLTCVLGKCMEHIVASRVMQHFTMNNILYNHQIQLST